MTSTMAELVHRALSLFDEYPALIFNSHMAFVRPSAELQELSIHFLILKAYSPAAYGRDHNDDSHQ